MLNNFLIAVALIVVSLTIALNSDRLHQASEALFDRLIRVARRVKFIAEALNRAMRRSDHYPYYS